MLLVLLFAISSCFALNCTGGLTIQSVVAKSTDVPVCLVFGEGSAVFYPQVDEWSLLEVEGSWNHTTKNAGSNDTNITIAISGARSPPARLNDPARNLTVPYFTVIAQLENGNVTSLVWDSDESPCLGCDASQCIDGNCAVPLSQCGTTADCDVRIYIGWIGKDADGNYCLSAGSRLSRYRRLSLTTLYNQIQGDVLSWVS